MSEDKILRTLRAQAWERAKGELMAVMQTYWYGNSDSEEESPYHQMDRVRKEFVEHVEGNGLAE